MPKLARKKYTFTLPEKLMERVSKRASFLYGPRGLSFFAERAFKVALNPTTK